MTATDTSHAPHPAGRFGRKDDELRLAMAALVQSHQQVLEHLTGLEAVHQAVAQLVKVPRRRVLWSGTAVLNSAGIWTRNFGTGAAAISVINFSVNDQVVVSADGPAGTAPGLGAGTHLLPAGAFGVFNGETTDWTLYGTAGDSFDVQVFSMPITPAAAGNI